MRVLQNGDSTLWQDYKNGSIEAFSKIYESEYPALYAFGHCFTSEDDLVKDCIQELFSELWQNRAKIAPVAKIKPYLMVYLKRKIIAQAKTDFQMSPHFPNEEVPYEKLLIDQETYRTLESSIKSSISKLTDRQREVIYLRFYAGLDYKDISKATSLKYQSIRNLMHDAIKALKKSIKPFVH